MKKRIFGIVTLIFSSMLAGCSDSKPSKLMGKVEAVQAVLPDGTSHIIVSDIPKNEYKRTVEIVLDARLSKEQLETLGATIRDAVSSQHVKTFISVYLHKTDNKNGTYAVIEAGRDEVISRIGGLSSAERNKLINQHFPEQGEFIAAFIDERGYVNQLLSLYQNGPDLNLVVSALSGVSSVRNLTVTKIEGRGTILDYENDHGEYFVINSGNNLEMWSQNGLYYTADLVLAD